MKIGVRLNSKLALFRAEIGQKRKLPWGGKDYYIASISGKRKRKAEHLGDHIGWVGLTLMIFGILAIVFFAWVGENSCVAQLV